ncbi:MAG: hypothetical protein K2L96_07090 [Muribaculaceae bacterium]|nr:hypothetical protein [Muribaculaceae bacterium]
MKKFYFALVAMLVSFCASAADYYLIGGFNGWALKQANCKFTDQGDGTYVLDYNGTLTSGFKINDGTWSNNNANFGGGGQLTIGQTYNLVVGGSSGNITMAGNIDNPHIVFNPTAKTLLISGQEVEAQYIYGLWGSFASSTWGAGDMTEKDGKWVIENLEVTYAGAAFGIKKMDAASGSQVDWISAAGVSAITEAGTYNCMVEGTNWTIATGTWSMSFDPEAMELVVTGEGNGDDPIPPTPTDYTGWYLNVQGDFNAWTPSGVAFNADGTVVAKNLAIGTGEFELKIWDGKADSYWGNASAVIVPGEPVQVYANGGHMTISDATADAVYDVEYNAVTEMMTVTKVGGGDDPIVDNSVYALHGQITGNAAWETIAMTKNEETGNWEYTGNIVAGEFGMFKDGSWMTGGGVTVTEENHAYSFTGAGNSTNELEGAYTIVYNPTEKTITFVPQDDIEIVTTYAIRGNMVTGEWADYAMTEENGLWSVELVVVPGEFGIKKMENGAQKVWYAAPTEEEATISAIGEFQAGDLGVTNWSNTLEGEYKFTFDPETMTLKVDTGSGVEAVEAAEAVEAVYYNLQGVRVANPANGLFIRVAGQKASKVYVK